MTVPVAAPAHRWKFTRAGATEQVVIRNGGDIVHLDQLDQKLWVALACPTRGLDFDPRTLDLIDTDGDGRIRPPELIEAGHWVRDRFADPGELFQGGDTVPLASINRTTEAGRQLATDAEEMLALLGKAGADCIGLDDVSDRGRLFAAMRFNGDGVIAPRDADDEVLRAAVAADRRARRRGCRPQRRDGGRRGPPARLLRRCPGARRLAAKWRGRHRLLAARRGHAGRGRGDGGGSRQGRRLLRTLCAGGVRRLPRSRH